MKIARCIQKFASSHPALKINKFYEVLGVSRFNHQYWLRLGLEDGTEIVQDPSSFLILDDEFER